jgi:hypothetical protein
MPYTKPYESCGDFILRATPEDIAKMTEIFKMIKPYDPSTLTGVVFSTSTDISSVLPQHRLLRRL